MRATYVMRVPRNNNHHHDDKKTDLEKADSRSIEVCMQCAFVKIRCDTERRRERGKEIMEKGADV